VFDIKTGKIENSATTSSGIFAADIKWWGVTVSLTFTYLWNWSYCELCFVMRRRQSYLKPNVKPLERGIFCFVT
jgi:hypothetical protein